MANEKRLIDANALELPNYGNLEHPDPFTEGFRQGKFDAVLEIMTLAPTVDAVEVVHGHWCWEGRFKACSKCGSYVEFTETLGASHWKYCPYCGAKMDGERRTDG